MVRYTHADYLKLNRSYYAYGVQISKLNSYKIVTSRYNFTRKADALLWAAKMVKKGQYATIVKYPNKYYEKASKQILNDSLYTISYERGDTVGTVRLSTTEYPVFVDADDEYMYLISPRGTLTNKRKSIWKDAGKR